MNIKLQCVGGGKMGEALLAGLVASKWAKAEELAVVEAMESRRLELQQGHPALTVTDSPLSDVDVLLAVKPGDVPAATKTLANLGIARLLSIAAGVRLDYLESQMDADCRIVRAMPNTPALLGAGAAAVAGGSAASQEDLSWAVGIMESVGVALVLPEESLDAVTGLSGSGPAYLFAVAEAMIAAGTKTGLSPEVADALVRQTLLGSAQLLAQGDDSPQQLRLNVTSPGGTTAAALEVFKEKELEQIFAEAIEAATQRSRELGSRELGGPGGS